MNKILIIIGVLCIILAILMLPGILRKIKNDDVTATDLTFLSVISIFAIFFLIGGFVLKL